jgi:hypothetical protein
MQRFLTQAAAIAITTQLASEYGWKASAGHRLFWFDTLRKTAPPVMHTFLPAKAPFPDLLCQTPDGWVAIESRGRSGAAPRNVPRKDQSDRIDQLKTWARRVQRDRGQAQPPKWAMAWATFLPGQTRIDFFDPGEDIKLSPEQEEAADDLTARFDSGLTEAIRDAPRPRHIQIRGRTLPAIISVADQPFGGRSTFVGIASASELDEPEPSGGARLSEDFDAILYRDNYYFAGAANAADLDELETVVSRAFRTELEA